MIPPRDNIPARTTPIVNYAMIGICAAVFMIQLSVAEGGGSLAEQLGMIPKRVWDPGGEFLIPSRRIGYGVPAPTALVPDWLTLLTCTFLHGGWLHFLGNMWFLWIFGDNVEDRMGHGGYLVFYLGAGVAASLAHLLASPESPLPTVGASGAIAGVMGAYMLLYPHAKVVTLIPLFIFIEILVLPAPLFLGFWFVLQLFQGVASVGSVLTGGVAWWAHIGGFAVGFVVAAILGKSHRLRPPVEKIRPHTDRITHYSIRPRRRRPH